MHDFTWADYTKYILTKINKNLAFLRRIKHLLLHQACIFLNRLVLPMLDYADLVCGEKNGLVLMAERQILQNKADKRILDRPLFS